SGAAAQSEELSFKQALERKSNFTLPNTISDNLLAAAPPKPIFTPRQVCSFYFKPCLDDEGEPTGYYSCKTCGKCYASVAATGTLLPWVGQKASNRFAWVRWVVIGNLPLSFCESKETRQYTKLNLISAATLTSLMEALLKAVETTIAEEMPDDFGLIIDGWTHAPDADIVHSVAFEKAKVKVFAGQAAMLTEEEAPALEPFKHHPNNAAGSALSWSSREGFTDRILKRRKVSAKPASYILLRANPQTSNMAERLFSVARHVLRHERQHLSPMMLEMIMFLKMNGTFYDVATVELGAGPTSANTIIYCDI
ncbi:hypothetical protein JG688_00016850, partial [Phytophthora aleatoria]